VTGTLKPPAPHKRPPPGIKRSHPAKLAALAPAHLHPLIAAKLADPASLPASVDLSKHPAYDQGQTSSCTAHALTKGIEIATGFLASQHVLYSMAGDLEGDTSDDGRQLVDCLTIVRTQGVAPYEGPTPDGRVSDVTPDNATTPATADEVAAAAQHCIDFGQTTINPSDPNLCNVVRATLAAGFTIYLGTQVGQAFMSLQGATVAQPDPANDPNGGGHALEIVGYKTLDDGTIIVLVENSWGESWDDNGECWASLAWVGACWELHPLVYTPAGPPVPPGPDSETLFARFEDAVKEAARIFGPQSSRVWAIISKHLRPMGGAS
jgi:hypothetical protein